MELERNRKYNIADGNWGARVLEEIKSTELFWRVYNMPRQVGATSFLIDLTNDLLNEEKKVIFIVDNHTYFNHLIKPFIRENKFYEDNLCLKTISRRDDVLKLHGLEKFDWMVVDNLRVDDTYIQSVATFITKNYIRIDTI